jgi:hypothetical protein
VIEKGKRVVDTHYSIMYSGILRIVELAMWTTKRAFHHTSVHRSVRGGR